MYISNMLFLFSEKHRKGIRKGKPKKKALNKRRNWILIKFIPILCTTPLHAFLFCRPSLFPPFVVQLLTSLKTLSTPFIRDSLCLLLPLNAIYYSVIPLFKVQFSFIHSFCMTKCFQHSAAPMISSCFTTWLS